MNSWCIAYLKITYFLALSTEQETYKQNRNEPCLTQINVFQYYF